MNRMKFRNKNQQKAADGERRCFMTGLPAERFCLIRFALGPDNMVYPDVNEKLGGRGVWMQPSRTLLKKACQSGLFTKPFKQKVKVSSELPDMVEKLLTENCLNLLGLIKKSGYLVCGMDNVKHEATALSVFVQANDGSDTEKQRMMRQVSKDALYVDDFTSEQLDNALGREFSVHLGLKKSILTERFKNEVLRLRAYLKEEV